MEHLGTYKPPTLASLASFRQEREAFEAGEVSNLQTTEGLPDCAKELKFRLVGNEGLRISNI